MRVGDGGSAPDARVEPCSLCRRVITNAGISHVVALSPETEIRRYVVESWVTDEDTAYVIGEYYLEPDESAVIMAMEPEA